MPEYSRYSFMRVSRKGSVSQSKIRNMNWKQNSMWTKDDEVCRSCGKLSFSLCFVLYSCQYSHRLQSTIRGYYEYRPQGL